VIAIASEVSECLIEDQFFLIGGTDALEKVAILQLTESLENFLAIFSLEMG
jgi:hypothetical protein